MRTNSAQDEAADLLVTPEVASLCVSKILDRIITSSSTVSSHSALSLSLISTSSQSQPSGDNHSNEDIKPLLYKLFNRNETNFINVANNEVMM